MHVENDEEWRGWFLARGIASVGARLPGPRLLHAHMTLDAARRGQVVALTNSFLIGDDIATGLLQRGDFGPESARPVAIGAYAFAARQDALSRPAVQKIRHWIAGKAAAFLDQSPIEPSPLQFLPAA